MGTAIIPHTTPIVMAGLGPAIGSDTVPRRMAGTVAGHDGGCRMRNNRRPHDDVDSVFSVPLW